MSKLTLEFDLQDGDDEMRSLAAINSTDLLVNLNNFDDYLDEITRCDIHKNNEEISRVLRTIHENFKKVLKLANIDYDIFKSFDHELYLTKNGKAKNGKEKE